MTIRIGWNVFEFDYEITKEGALKISEELIDSHYPIEGFSKFIIVKENNSHCIRKVVI